MRMMERMTDASRLFASWLAVVALVLAGCESIGPVGKRIDYKSTSAAPPLELPPELSQPRYDDRFAVSTASGLAAANAARPNRNDLLPSNPEAKIARSGNERWIVAKATPEQAWSMSRQVPTVMMDNRYGAGFAWAVMPPNPNLEAEMLSRLMMRFSAPESQAAAATAANTSGTALASTTPDRARVEKGADGVSKLIVDDPFDRAWRRVGLALDRSGFTVVDRDRSSGVYFVRYADPDSDMTKKDHQESWLAKLAFWRKDEKDKPEQYRIKVVEAAPASVVSVQDPKGAPDRTQNSEKILALLKDQLK